MSHKSHQTAPNNVIKTIFIPPAHYHKLGFLNNDSKHGFYDSNGTWWPTVTHYIEAQKFKGTKYEDEIRECVTVAQVRYKTKERMMITYRANEKDNNIYNTEIKIICGKKIINLSISKSKRLNDTINDITYAIKEKFKNNVVILKKLVQTYPKIILFDIKSLIYVNDNANLSPYDIYVINKLGEHTSNALMAIRKDNLFILDKMRIKQEIKDLPSCAFADDRAVLIRKVLMILSKYISKMEKWDKIFPEMVDDAIYYLCDKTKKFLRSKENEIKFDADSHKKTPNIVKYMYETKTKFEKIDPFQTITDKPSQQISKFILWCYSSGYMKVIYKRARRYYKIYNGKLRNFKKKKNIIPVKGNRWYRSRGPTDIIIKKRVKIVKDRRVMSENNDLSLINQSFEDNLMKLEDNVVPSSREQPQNEQVNIPKKINKPRKPRNVPIINNSQQNINNDILPQTNVLPSQQPPIEINKSENRITDPNIYKENDLLEENEILKDLLIDNENRDNKPPQQDNSPK